mmetsp:Transcript_28228/g.46802  ORF Transcript_28228/g.46802 Transcript_28228/m.46802 type:complete len:281 (-) Transcript_28228:66-908(-)
MEGDDGIVWDIFWKSRLDHLEERFLLFFPINYHLASEEPMSGMFGVRLTHVETLDIGRVATEFLLEQLGIVVQIEVIKSKSSLLVDSFQGSSTVFHDGNCDDWFRLSTIVEGGQGFGIFFFRHSVVQHSLESLDAFLAEVLTEEETVASREFKTFHRNITCLTDAAGVRREGRRERHARTEFDFPGSGSGRLFNVEERLLQFQVTLIKGLSQEPFQTILLDGRQIVDQQLHIEARFCFDGRNLPSILSQAQGGQLLLAGRQQGVRSLGFSVVVNDLFYHD